MKIDIPKAKAKALALKSLSARIDAEFNALPSPATYRPNATPGQLLDAMTRRSHDYRQSIENIRSKASAEIAEVEQTLNYVDRYANTVLLACHHIESGHDLRPPFAEGSNPVIESALLLRRAKQAGLIEQAELDLLVKRTRDDLRESLTELNEASGWAKKYRRAARKAILSRTAETIDALLSQKNSSLTEQERTRLKAYGKKAAARNEVFGQAYKRQYFSKSGHRKDVPTRGFSALERL